MTKQMPGWLAIIGWFYLASILIPPLAAMIGRAWGVAILATSLTLLAGGGSIYLVFDRSIGFWQWCQCEMVLGSFFLAIGLSVLLLMRWGCDAAAASAIVTVLVVAWLTAPVWLSVPLAGQRLHYSVALHPLFVLNGIVPQLGIWTEQQVAYRLISIGQDVQYDLPGSPWLFVGVYGVIGFTCAAMTKRKIRI
jgi:hypothetical protein